MRMQVRFYSLLLNRNVLLWSKILGDMFEVKTDGQEPIPQYGQALVYHHGYLYTIGGTTGFAYTCDIHR